ncbi:MAG: DegT/DnrJ/EryC1/StrS family aminotransferase [Salinivirgaceae bacterium]|nr:DegT/DnrJ/EryC1/StrS family aminotransferase [Salinivirgaceae bacterium]
MENFVEILKQAWDTRVLTHNGPLVQRLEKEVNKILELESTIALTNGTIALQLAIRSLELKGEIITTPFSWIATASAIKWEGCRPVFVDIDPETLNIDPKKIEAAITSDTVAIMPVHVFSNPCDIDAIEEIAKRFNLKVIYDAAHSFMVNYKGKSIMEYGDVSCTSFHATKLFNTGEGGACFTNNVELFEKLKRLRFFGHNEAKEIVEDGLNGKMTEIHAAVGLANLPFLSEVLSKRKAIYNIYKEKLSHIEAISFQRINESEYNYSYMPLIFNSEEECLKILASLNESNIFPRRYFYPSLNTISAVKHYSQMKHSEDIASRILCLPSHNDLDFDQVNEICDIILKNYY